MHPSIFLNFFSTSFVSPQFLPISLVSGLPSLASDLTKIKVQSAVNCNPTLTGDSPVTMSMLRREN